MIGAGVMSDASTGKGGLAVLVLGVLIVAGIALCLYLARATFDMSWGMSALAAPLPGVLLGFLALLPYYMLKDLLGTLFGGFRS